MVGQADGVRMMGWLGEPDRLGRVFGCLGESAEVGEGDAEPEAIVDRGRLTASKELVDPVGGQRGQIGRRQLDHSRVLAAVEMRLYEVGRGEDAEPQVPEACGDLQRAPAAHERLVRIAKPCVDVRHEGADPTSPGVVVQSLGESLGLAQQLQHLPQLTELGQHQSQREADLERLLQRGPTLRQRVQGAERLCKPRPCILERRPRHRLVAGLPEIAHGLVRQFAAERVKGELLDLLAEAISIEWGHGADDPRADRLERLGHGAMEEPSARREQPAIRDLADPIVGEVQLVSHGLEHLVADYLLDRRRRVALVHLADGVEEREVEAPPDHRGHGDDLLTAPAEPVDPPGDQITDARGQGERAGCLAGAIPPAGLIERANRLHGDEGIALTHRPDLLLDVRHRLRVAPDTGERPEEQGGIGS